MTAAPHDDLEPVSLARTDAERNAVYRLRYEVYMRELRKGFLSDVDHDDGLVRDPADEQDGVCTLYTGTADDVTGSLRLQVWEPGCVPKDVYQRFSLQLFPGIEALKISEVARLVIRPDMRGGRLLTSLASAAFRLGTANHGVFVCFLYCSPGLLRPYMRLGFRPYPGYVIPNADGVRLPMFLTASDLVHLRAIGSPLAPLMEARYPAYRETPEMARFLEAATALPEHYVTDPGRIWQEVRERLRPGPETICQLLEGVPVDEVRLLCSFGFVMEIPSDKVVIREGLVERELYLVLQGRYEVQMDDKPFAELGEGDVIGEVSFFQNPGERVATIRSLTPGRVMVIERHFVEHLIPSHPELACRLLLNLGRILSSHLTTALRAYISER